VAHTARTRTMTVRLGIELLYRQPLRADCQEQHESGRAASRHCTSARPFAEQARQGGHVVPAAPRHSNPCTPAHYRMDKGARLRSCTAEDWLPVAAGRTTFGCRGSPGRSTCTPWSCRGYLAGADTVARLGLPGFLPVPALTPRVNACAVYTPQLPPSGSTGVEFNSLQCQLEDVEA